jgi:hypothetical protein
MAMPRTHLMLNWFDYSDPTMEKALHETSSRFDKGCKRIVFDLELPERTSRNRPILLKKSPSERAAFRHFGVATQKANTAPPS